MKKFFLAAFSVFHSRFFYLANQTALRIKKSSVQAGLRLSGFLKTYKQMIKNKNYETDTSLYELL